MKRSGKWKLGCWLMAFLVAVILISWPLVVELPVILMPLPGGHPTELLGKWEIQREYFRKFMFLDKDGHGIWWSEAAPHPTLSWGTTRDVIVSRYMATDAWVIRRHRYDLSADGQILTLRNIDYPDASPTVFRRVP